MHWHAACRKRERDPAGPDTELERAIVPCELSQEIDRGCEDHRVEPVRGILVYVAATGSSRVAIVTYRATAPRAARPICESTATTSAVSRPPFSWSTDNPALGKRMYDVVTDWPRIGPAAYRTTTQEDELR